MYAPMETLVEAHDEVLLPSPRAAAPNAAHAQAALSQTARTWEPANAPDAQVKESPREPAPVAPQLAPPAKTERRESVPDGPRSARPKRLSVERSRVVFLRDHHASGEDDGVVDVPLVPVPSNMAASSRPFTRAAPLEVALTPQRTAQTQTDDEAGSTVVNVVIGRIDVRAGESETKPKREEPFRPRVSLEAYLSGRGGER